MNVHAKSKLAQVRAEKRMLSQNIDLHKKRLVNAKDGQLKTMMEKSIETDAQRIEMLAAIEKALGPLAGEPPASPVSTPPAT